MSGGATRPRLLFVLSSDFGALSNAIYLASGGPFETRLLVPPRLHRDNAGSLPFRSSAYRAVADVLAALDRERPDLVLLFSAYLYGMNRLIGEADLARLLDDLRTRSLPCVVDDPFLGIVADVDETTFTDRHPLKQQLIRHFSGVARLLRGLPHLYVVDPTSFGPPGSVSFYNERIVRSPAELAAMTATLARRPGYDAGRRRWLFVLAAEDYTAQLHRLGRPAFHELLLARLREATAAGRQPVLLAPSVCVDALRPDAALLDGAVLLPFCGYELFTTLLLEAEYVFYWNFFSSTIPIRLLHRLPFFCLDTGHMALAMPRLFEIGMREYYRGADLMQIDQRAPLDGATLARLAEDCEERFASARCHFRRSPTPEQMVRGLLAGAPREATS